MIREASLVGAIVIYRQEVRPFTDKQIELVKNFAAQAVIAIENTRLLNELRQIAWSSRLRQQRCFKSSVQSPGELEPVFDAMLENAVQICERQFRQHLVVRRGCSFACAAHAQRRRISHTGGATEFTVRPGMTLRPVAWSATKGVIHVADLAADQRLRQSGRRALLCGCRAHARSGRPNAQGRRTDRCNHHLPPGSSTIHR